MTSYSVSDIRFTYRNTATTGLSLSYWMLLLFVLLLFLNLPLLVPALQVIRPAQLVAGATLATLLVETVFARKNLEFAWPEGGLLVAFLCAGALSCLTALWPRQAAEAVSDLVKMILVYFFLVNCVNSERRVRGVMWVMVIGGLVPAAGTLKNYMQGTLEEGRAAWVGIFANPNEMAYSLIVLLPLAGFLASSLGLLPRLALTGIALVYMAAIFVTFSRGGLVALGAIMALYAWRKKSALLQGLMVLVAAGGLLFSGQYWSRSEDFSSLKGDVSFQQRIATSQAGIAMFADNPVLGVGLGCSMIAWPLYAPENLYTRGTLVTHNTFIQALGETGLIGSIPFFLFVGAGIWYARKLALSSAKKSMTNLGIALEVSLWGFVVCGLSGGYVLTWFPYILIGLVSAARRIETEEAA